MKKGLITLLGLIATIIMLSTAVIADDTNVEDNREPYAEVEFNWKYNIVTDREAAIVYSLEEFKSRILYIHNYYTISVKILKDDVVIPYPLLTESLYIDANGHTFTFEGGDVYVDGSYKNIDGNNKPSVSYLRISNADLSNYPTQFIVDNGCSLELVNCLFDGKNQTYIKSIIKIGNNAKLDLTNTTIKNYKMKGDNGVIAISGHDSDVVIWSENTLIENCSHDDDGGVIFDDNNNTILMTGITFKNNSCDGDGGAICAENASLSGCTFIGNKATGDGGAVYGGVYTRFCNFENNSCDGDGGAIYTNEEQLLIGNCTFISNICNGDGGAICVFQDYNHINSCTFENNKAYDDGGAIYVCNNTDSIIIDNCKFKNDWANDEGWEVVGDGDTVLENSEVINSEGEDSVEDCKISETSFSGSGSIISSGNIWMILCIAEALAIVAIILYFKRKQTVNA